MPTVKRLQARDKPTGRHLPPRGKPTVKRLRANVGLVLVKVLPGVSGLQPLGMLLPIGVPALVGPPQRVSGLQLPVRPQLAGLAAAEARVPSEEAPGDTTDLALAPPAPAVPPAWDHAAVEAFAVEVAVVDADEWAAASASSRLLASGWKLAARSQEHRQT